MNYRDFEKIFKHIDNFTWWPCDVAASEIFDIAKNNFEKLSSGATKNKIIIRTAGQSGSGKTTQLLPTCHAIFDKLNINPVHLCVREFANLHPRYDEIKNEYGASEIREKTNGFALRCLVVSAVMAIINGYDILFEVTILTPKFEDFLFRYIRDNKYKTLFLCLAVSKQLSDFFIEKRKKGKSFENGRIISKESSVFFYNTLTDAIKYFAGKGPYERIIVWDAYHKRPIYDGLMKNALPKIEEGRTKIGRFRYSEEALRESKKNYLLKHFKQE